MIYGLFACELHCMNVDNSNIHHNPIRMHDTVTCTHEEHSQQTVQFNTFDLFQVSLSPPSSNQILTMPLTSTFVYCVGPVCNVSNSLMMATK